MGFTVGIQNLQGLQPFSIRRRSGALKPGGDWRAMAKANAWTGLRWKTASSGCIVAATSPWQSLQKAAPMVRVLCTGVDRNLIETRKRILERAGYSVVAAIGVRELQTVCESNAFDVAVIGQTTSNNEKRRLLAVIREKCPAAKVLSLFTAATGRLLPDADDWLQVPLDIPPQLAERVAALAAGKSN